MNDSDQKTKHYEVQPREQYIYLKLKGIIQISDLHDSTSEVVEIAEKQKMFMLLDDIRELNRSSITIKLQTSAIGELWRLRIFQKIAIVYDDDEIGQLVKVTLTTVRFMSKARAFDNEPDAIAWLQEAPRED